MPDVVKGLDIRKKILQYSLMLESFTSMFLTMILDIKEFSDSNSLGNKSSALSFMNKINLFLDLGAINSKERAKFDRFMSIRNQFIHSITADSYTACVSHIEGLETKLLNDYKSTFPTKEQQLEYAVDQLVEEVFDLSITIYQKAEQKIRDRVEAKLYKGAFPVLLEHMKSRAKE